MACLHAPAALLRIAPQRTGMPAMTAGEGQSRPCLHVLQLCHYLSGWHWRSGSRPFCCVLHRGHSIIR